VQRLNLKYVLPVLQPYFFIKTFFAMKVYTGLFAVLFLICTTAVMAQEQASSKVVVIAKIKNEDGVMTTVTRVMDGEQADAYVKSMESDLDGQEFTIDLKGVEDGQSITADKIIIIDRSSDEKECNIRVNRETTELFKMIERHTGEQMDNLAKEEFFVRGGQWKQSTWSPAAGNMTKRAILGVYAEGEPNDKGVVITGLTSKSGAAAAGISEGDIIQTVDGKSTVVMGSIGGILSTRKPGEQVEVTYLRDGQSRKVMVVLGESTDWNWTNGRVERDPCQVFIGVYTSTNSDGDGVDVNGIISGTPAETSGVQRGDVIIEMDGISVNTHNELLTERNKHKPGQEFTLTILRNGAVMDIDTRFKACSTDVKQAPIEEEIPQELVVEELPAAIDAPVVNTEIPKLNLEVFQAFPNPTTGVITMRFQAEAMTTVIQIADVTGKIIFQDNLNNFDGYYDRQIDLTGSVPGTMTLTIRQGKQVFTQALVLITRA